MGITRLTSAVPFEEIGPVVTFTPLLYMVGNDKGIEYARIYMFVVSPIVMPYPYAISVRVGDNMSDKIINKFLEPLGEDQKILSLEFLDFVGMVLDHSNRSLGFYCGPPILKQRIGIWVCGL